MYRPNGSNDLKRKIRNIVTGKEVAPQSWDLRSIFDFSGLFSEIQDFTNLAFIENWDVSHVKKMAYMFSHTQNHVDSLRILLIYHQLVELIQL